MSDYLQLENRILKLELRVIELENQLAQARGGSNGAAPSPSPNVVPPASGNTPGGTAPPTDEEIRSYQKVRNFMDFLGNCR